MAAGNDADQAFPQPAGERRIFTRRRFLQASALAVTAGAASGVYSWNAARMEPAEISDWAAANIPSQRGRRVIVTGGNGYPQGDRSGLGYHQALFLARAGADVTIASRKAERGAEAVRRIQAAVPGAKIGFETLDLAHLESVRTFADRMRASGDSLDLLINNAGVMGRLTREESRDGFERVFATNMLGPFVLTARLLPLLQNTGNARIAWVASMRANAGAINFDDLQQEKLYDYPRTYDDAKLANLLIAFELERRSKAAGWGITSLAAHPGVARTNIVPDGPGLDSTEGWRFRNIRPMWQDPAQGALPLLFAATSVNAVGGGFYGPIGFMGLTGRPGETAAPDTANDREVASKLWTTLEELGGVSFG